MAVNVRHPSGKSRIHTLRILGEAEEKRVACYDQTSEQQIVSQDGGSAGTVTNIC